VDAEGGDPGTGRSIGTDAFEGLCIGDKLRVSRRMGVEAADDTSPQFGKEKLVVSGIIRSLHIGGESS